MRNALQYIVDKNGIKISVIVPFDKWEKINAVKMMRDIRDNHRKLYEHNPEIREKRLKEIRIKYAKKITPNDSNNLSFGL